MYIAQNIYKCDVISTDSGFDMFILLCVFCSVLVLAFLETDIGDESVILFVDEIIKYIFLGEVLVKLIGLGV